MRGMTVARSHESNGGHMTQSLGKSSALDTLRVWQCRRLDGYRNGTVRFPADLGPKNVTAVLYFFQDEKSIETAWPFSECAILETWHHCGFLKTVLVVDRTSSPVLEFAQKYPPWVSIQEEPELMPGDIGTLSRECIQKLHARFPTEYVLTIQDDGFPLKNGLDKFLGNVDFYGAPWPGHTSWTDLYPYPRYAVGNGGFSLRSKRICEAASMAWERGWKHLWKRLKWPEDTFYCKVMPFFSRPWRKAFRYPSLQEAADFSLECIVPRIGKPPVPPLGFHSPQGFLNYITWFGNPS